MDDLGNILYILIFVIISLLSAMKDKKKKKEKKQKQQAPKPATTPKPVASKPEPVKPKKEKSPLELLEEMFNDMEKEPEPVYTPPVFEEKPKPEPVVVQKQSPEIDLPKKKSYIRKSENSIYKNRIREKLKNPDTIKDLIVTSEILGKPKALQD